MRSTSGDGGKVIVWADDTTRFMARSARAAARSRATAASSKPRAHYLDVTSAPSVAAPAGRGGTWLLDPGEIVISAAGADTNIGGGSGLPFTPVSGDAISTITQSLINGSLFGGDVTISTGGPGGGNGNITFDAAPGLGGAIVITKFDMGPLSTLSLVAAGDIRFRNGTTTFQTSGGGNPNLTVQFRPGQDGSGSVITETGATTTLARNNNTGAVGAQVQPGKTWQNNGTINLAEGTSIRLLNDLAFATLENATGGVINITSAGDEAALRSDGLTRGGIVNNAGTIEVNSSTAFEVAFSNLPGGTLNVNSGTLSLANGKTIAGNVTIAPAASLQVTESQVPGALFEGTAISGGTVAVVGGEGALTSATFRNVTAGSTALNVAGNGVALFDTAPSTFSSVTLQLVPPQPDFVSGALTSNTGLTINNGLEIGGVATFNGITTVGSTVSLGAGTLAGTGAFSAPSLNWIGGTISGTGIKTFTTSVTSVDSIAPVNLSGNIALTGGTWTNNGTLSQSGDGQLTLSNGAVVDNVAVTGNWNVSSSNLNPIAHGTGATTRFNNNGNFTNNGATPHTLTVLEFRNTGNVTLAPGSTLGLPAGALSADTGSISLGNAAIVDFEGDRTLAPASTISGANGGVSVSGGTVEAKGFITATGALTISGGTANFDTLTPLTPSTATVTGTGTANFNVPLSAAGQITVAGGTANFNVPLTANADVSISGGFANFNAVTNMSSTLTLSGGVAGGGGPVSVGGLLTWSGGEMRGPGTTTANGGIAINQGAKSITAGHTLVNSAGQTATWTGGGAIQMSGGATISNQGIWADNSVDASILGDAGSQSFNNVGTYTKSTPAITTIGPGVDFNNTGTGVVNVDSGTLRLAGGGTSSGVFNVPAALDFNAGTYNVTAGTISGAGTVIVSGATTNLNGGNVRHHRRDSRDAGHRQLHGYIDREQHRRAHSVGGHARARQRGDDFHDGPDPFGRHARRRRYGQRRRPHHVERRHDDRRGHNQCERRNRYQSGREVDHRRPLARQSGRADGHVDGWRGDPGEWWRVDQQSGYMGRQQRGRVDHRRRRRRNLQQRRHVYEIGFERRHDDRRGCRVQQRRRHCKHHHGDAAPRGRRRKQRCVQCACGARFQCRNLQRHRGIDLRRRHRRRERRDHDPERRHVRHHW